MVNLIFIPYHHNPAARQTTLMSTPVVYLDLKLWSQCLDLIHDCIDTIVHYLTLICIVKFNLINFEIGESPKACFWIGMTHKEKCPIQPVIKF